MSTTDTADVLEITEENVKVRLHRARALLRKSLFARDSQCPECTQIEWPTDDLK